MRVLFVLTFFSVLIFSCEKEEEVKKTTRSTGGGKSVKTDILISDTIAYAGDTISIIGSQFIKNKIKVFFDDKEVALYDFSSEKFKIVVPDFDVSKIHIQIDNTKFEYEFHQYKSFCNMTDSLTISDLKVTSIEGGVIYYSFMITNISQQYLDMKIHDSEEFRSDFTTQSYTSNFSDGSNQSAAGGSVFSTKNLAPSETVEASFSANDTKKDYVVLSFYYSSYQKTDQWPWIDLCEGVDTKTLTLITKVDR